MYTYMYYNIAYKRRSFWELSAMAVAEVGICPYRRIGVVKGDTYS